MISMDRGGWMDFGGGDCPYQVFDLVGWLLLSHEILISSDPLTCTSLLLRALCVLRAVSFIYCDQILLSFPSLPPFYSGKYVILRFISSIVPFLAGLTESCLGKNKHSLVSMSVRHFRLGFCLLDECGLTLRFWRWTLSLSRQLKWLLSHRDVLSLDHCIPPKSCYRSMSLESEGYGSYGAMDEVYPTSSFLLHLAISIPIFTSPSPDSISSPHLPALLNHSHLHKTHYSFCLLQV